MAQGVLTTMPVYGPTGSPSAAPAPVAPGTPTFQDILDRLGKPLAGQQNFQSGLDTLKPSTGLDPAYQKAIDQIRSNAKYYGAQASSDATALAAKRGITGSSTEAFGVQTGLDNVNRAASDQEAQLALQQLTRSQAVQDNTANAYFNRANAEGTAGTSLATTGATLTSDEIASVRNMGFQDQLLKLQQSLGQQGIDVAKMNAQQAADIANKNGLYSLGAALLSGGVGNSLLSSLGIGGGTAATTGAAGAGTAGAGTAAAGAGAGAGTGVAGLAAAHPAAALAAAGIGAMAISKEGEKVGGTAGGVLANPIGYQLNLAKDIAKNPKQAISKIGSNISSTVSKVFGGGKTSNGNDIANTASQLQDSFGQLQDLKTQLQNGQITQAQYNAQATPIAAQAGALAQGSIGKNSAWATAINPEWKRFQDAGLVTAQNGKWVLGSDASAPVLWSNGTTWNGYNDKAAA